MIFSICHFFFFLKKTKFCSKVWDLSLVGGLCDGPSDLYSGGATCILGGALAPPKFLIFFTI